MQEKFKLTKNEEKILENYGLKKDELTNCSVRIYKSQERIITEGLNNENIFIIVEGSAKVGAMAPNGKSLILYFYVSSGVLGDIEFLNDYDLGRATVTAMNTFRCVAIPINENREYLKNNLIFMQTVATQLAQKLMDTTDSIVENTLYNAETRLCRYIMAVSQNGWFRDIMSDTAYSIGISYRHLYRMMNKLCCDNILEKHSSGYKICNLNELKCRSQKKDSNR
ncbi:MAG: cyclic nucleotide-binding domain-containing protein [Erysipelotrichia bacterium]|nr:cyclic nucleotide-binding domain-containing protein [Erysipelotrichia bacterium]